MVIVELMACAHALHHDICPCSILYTKAMKLLTLVVHSEYFLPI